MFSPTRAMCASYEKFCKQLLPPQAVLIAEFVEAETGKGAAALDLSQCPPDFFTCLEEPLPVVLGSSSGS